MKFEYKTKRDDRECVAFIDECGELLIKLEDGRNVIMEESGRVFSGGVSFDMLLVNAVHKFYPGDSVKITF